MKKQKTNIGRLIRVVCIAMFAAIAVSLLGLAACKPDESSHKHTLTVVSKQDATCTEKGNEAYWKCDGCGKMFSDGEGKNEIQSVPEIAAKGHSVPTMTETKPADCTNKGQKSGKCEVCQQTVTEDIPALGHNAVWTAVDEQTHIKKCTRCEYTEGDAEPHNFVGDECTDCGAKKAIKPYTLSEDGKTLTFGSYPQSKVEDTALQSMLNAAIQNKTPTADNFNGWTDYEYYVNGQITSYTWYIDVDYQGARYRGVYFTLYRPIHTWDFEGDPDWWSTQYDNGYETGNVYWFKWAPIKWQVLTTEDNKLLVMTDWIIDCQQYYHNSDEDRYIEVEPYFIQANNYKESEIRGWLNEDFYDTAFDELSKEFICQTEVDNSASTTNRSDNRYVCENTNDYIFLLSYKDVKDVAYGFENNSASCSARHRKNTDYAQCQGVLTEEGYGPWWLRSPDYQTPMAASYVYGDGMIDGTNLDVYYIGVVPALWLTL